jgi:hypothetical protein
MKRSLRAFMNGLIDYAGLFPPARLDLETAVQNFVRYRQEPSAWMLGRFIIPAARLHELEAFRPELFDPASPPFRVSVLLATAAQEQEALAKIKEDAESVRSFLLSLGDQASVEAFEVRLPEESAAAGRAAAFLNAAGPILWEGEDVPAPELFVEVPLLENQKAVDATVIAALADFGRDLAARRGEGAAPRGEGAAPRGEGAAGQGTVRLSRAGYKLRCGGLDAQAIPAPARVAAIIARCRDQAVPLKCTAGLHHPLRHFASDVDATSHGFFNLFGAGILARARNWSEDRIEACLIDEQAEDFRFEDAGFAWHDTEVSTLEVEEARRIFMTGFGSCSFEEPLEDLAALGLLDD